MCEDAPIPPCALFHVLPVLLHVVHELEQILAGESLRATMTAGECAVKPIGLKSRSESYFTFGVSNGADTCDPMLPARRVYPSGSAAATRALPIVPPAPPTFSMTSVCPRIFPI